MSVPMPDGLKDRLDSIEIALLALILAALEREPNLSQETQQRLQAAGRRLRHDAGLKPT